MPTPFFKRWMPTLYILTKRFLINANTKVFQQSKILLMTKVSSRTIKLGNKIYKKGGVKNWSTKVNYKKERKQRIIFLRQREKESKNWSSLCQQIKQIYIYRPIKFWKFQQLMSVLSHRNNPFKTEGIWPRYGPVLY